jgi:hypothetical protein
VFELEVEDFGARPTFDKAALRQARSAALARKNGALT